LRFKVIILKSQATQKEVNSIVEESKADWWRKNKNQFIN